MPEGWSEFFVATTGAGAALVGLIIVAMTANIKEIIAIPSMASRAAATIGSLTLIVVSGAASLVPQQDASLLGLELLLFTLLALGLDVDSAWRIVRASKLPGYQSGRPTPKIVLAFAQIAPFIVGAALLVAGDWAGLGWIAAGVIAVFIGSVWNAWILLVEILR
jgi:modulator of FtsH protease